MVSNINLHSFNGWAVKTVKLEIMEKIVSYGHGVVMGRGHYWAKDFDGDWIIAFSNGDGTWLGFSEDLYDPDFTEIGDQIHEPDKYK